MEPIKDLKELWKQMQKIMSIEKWIGLAMIVPFIILLLLCFGWIVLIVIVVIITVLLAVVGIYLLLGDNI